MGLEKRRFESRSEFQHVVIGDVPVWGRALFLDGDPQLLQADEFIYHEHLVLLPLLCHPSPRRVLILGGGDGLALREALRDRRLEEVVLVDIDGVVVDACREHLAELHRGSFDHPNARVIVDDARHFLAAERKPFDVVIMDLVDPGGETGASLYADVILGVKSVSTEATILSTNGGSVDPPGYSALRVRRLLSSLYRHTEVHRAHVPSFCREWGLVVASDGVDFRALRGEVLCSRLACISDPPRALVPERYPVAYQLPRFLADADETLDTAAPMKPTHRVTFEWLDRATSASPEHGTSDEGGA